MLAIPIVSLLLMLGRGWLFGDTVRYKIMLMHMLWDACRHLSEHYMAQVHFLMYFITMRPHSSQWILGVDVYWVTTVMSLQEMAGEAASRLIPKLIVGVLCAAWTYLAKPSLASMLGRALQDVVQNKLAFTVMELSEKLPPVYRAAQVVRERRGEDPSKVFASLSELAPKMFQALASEHARVFDKGPLAALRSACSAKLKNSATDKPAGMTKSAVRDLLHTCVIVIHVISGLFTTSDFMVTTLIFACCGEALAMLEESL